VRTPPRILIADDQPMNRDILQTRLSAHGYEIITAADGEEALALARSEAPDLILLDVMMPRLDGIAVCRALKADDTLRFTPIILVTAKTDSRDVVAGLEAGGDEYLAKPVDPAALVARVHSMLRIKALHDTVQEQTVQLAAQASQLAEWNQTLERRVQEQLAEIERVSRLRRFLSPQLADQIVSSGEEVLQVKRRQVAVLTSGLAGFAEFAEAAEPEEAIEVLRTFHREMGSLVHRFEGTIDHRAGDRTLVLFNAPLPCPVPAARAVRLAIAMRERMASLAANWRLLGHELGLAVGIAFGYATVGLVGDEGRLDYTANGSVVQIAARLSEEATDGQILVTQRVVSEVKDLVKVEPHPPVVVAGTPRAVAAANVVALRPTEPVPDGGGFAASDPGSGPTEKVPYVFLSYASAEREYALKMADALETNGVGVWLDRRSIAGGSSWSAEIVRGIQGCAAVLVLCSATSMASPNVRQEVQLAWESHRPIVPLRLSDDRPPEAIQYALAGRQWIEVHERAEREWLPAVLRGLRELGIRPR
jgi:DNA-binding response OmpR family regulator